MTDHDEQIDLVWNLLIEPRDAGTPCYKVAERIVDALAQPVEVTDEMVERAYCAFLGSDVAYVSNRVGLRNMRAALRAALHGKAIGG